jgi:hypothetical protein
MWRCGPRTGHASGTLRDFARLLALCGVSRGFSNPKATGPGPGMSPVGGPVGRRAHQSAFGRSNIARPRRRCKACGHGAGDVEKNQYPCRSRGTRPLSGHIAPGPTHRVEAGRILVAALRPGRRSRRFPHQMRSQRDGSGPESPAEAPEWPARDPGCDVSCRTNHMVEPEGRARDDGKT